MQSAPAVVRQVPGSRGKAALALDLDFLIDDLPRNCIDVASDSRCRPILVSREPAPDAEAAAARLQIAIVRSVSDALDLILAESPDAPAPGPGRRWRQRLGF